MCRLSQVLHYYHMFEPLSRFCTAERVRNRNIRPALEISKTPGFDAAKEKHEILNEISRNEPSQDAIALSQVPA